MWRAGRSASYALAAAVPAVLAGCEGWPDAGEARDCRTLTRALNPPGSTIEVLSTIKTADGDVEVRYQASGVGQDVRRRSLVCRFSARDLPGGDRLSGATSDGVPISEVRLTLLKRFWLRTTDAGAADPAPYLWLGWGPEVPRLLALAMQHTLSGLPPVSIYALLAPAYALIYGLIGRINLAFGEFAAIGGYGALIAVWLAAGSGWPVVIMAGLVLGVWAAGLHGLVASRLVFAPLRGAGGQHVLVATIGLAIALEEYLRLSQGPALRWVEPVLNQPLGLARSQGFVVAVTPMALIVSTLALCAALALLALLKWTRYGRHWRACADDPAAAMLVGIDPSSVLVRSLGLASVLAGAAGTIATLFFGGVGHAGGILLGLKALIAAVIGGVGSVPGAFLGAILIGAAEILWSALFPIEYRDLAIYGLLAAMLIWRPGGLFGQRDQANR